MSADRHESQPSALTRGFLGRTLGGRYRITSALGRGGAGMVFLAVQEPLGREVAVKVLRVDLEGASKTEYEARFLREAEVCGRLSHPNVVTVHDYGTTDDGLRYVVMERLTGPTLAGLVRGGDALEPRRAARIVADLGRGLAAAHDAGLIHRDVKPHNVIVQTEDGRERPVLLDFGLAKVSSERADADSFKTRAGSYMGTPAYMAPEQAEGRDLDHRADLYALGCVLYRLLTGTTPYDAEHPLGMAVQHMTQPYPSMRVRAPERDIPHALEAITERAMRKAPDDRYLNARDMVADLDAFLAGKAITPGPAASRTLALGAGVGAVSVGVGVLGVVAVSIGLALIAAVVWLVVPDRAEPVDTLEPAVLLDPVPSPIPMPLHSPVPAPVPAPVPDLALAPTPVVPKPVVPKPVVPEPVRPTPTPAPAPSGGDALIADGVPYTAAQAERAVRFANTATKEQLEAAGVHRMVSPVVLDNRPYASLQALAGTKGIGPKTMEALRDGAR